MFDLLKVALLSVAPISELRLAIPLGIKYGYSAIEMFLFCTSLNILVIPPLFFLLDTALKWAMRFSFVRLYVDRVMKKIGPYVEKYGLLYLTLYVAIPLPFSGAYTGTIIAYVLGVRKKPAFLAISLGVVIAGILVTFFSKIIIEHFKTFGFVVFIALMLLIGMALFFWRRESGVSIS